MNFAGCLSWLSDKESLKLFEEHVMPLASPGNGRIAGGLPKIMYKDWAYQLAEDMQNHGIDVNLITWEQSPEGEPGETYPIYNFARMERVFGFMAQMLSTKWHGMMTEEGRAKYRKVSL